MKLMNGISTLFVTTYVRRAVYFTVAAAALYLCAAASSLFLASPASTQTFPGSPNPGVSTNTANATVRRDSSGNFAANQITLSAALSLLGTVSGNAPYVQADAGNTLDLKGGASGLRMLNNAGSAAVFTVGNTGAVNAAAGYSNNGTAGGSRTITVKGSDGNNCNIVFGGGIHTTTTCP